MDCAAAQGIDTDGARYAVFCEEHGTLVGETSLARARLRLNKEETTCP